MEGRSAQSRLTPLSRGGVLFTQAQARDEADVRALLASHAMGGRVQLAFERGPGALAPLGPSVAHVMMIARDETSGAAVGVYERVTRRLYVNGEPVRAPYLAALRIAPSHRRRIALLLAGFDSLRAYESDDEEPYAITSIGADNGEAIRLLTARLPGLPRYERMGTLATLALRTARVRTLAFEHARAHDFDALSAFLNARNRTRQFAPVWSPDDLGRLAADGLTPEHILLARSGATITGAIAIWDQTARRRTVVRAYPPALARLRTLVNLASPLSGLPPLPREGEPLRQATLALIAVADDDEALMLALVDAALAQAHARRLTVGALGLPAAHPWLQALQRRRRALTYRTELFRVAWEGSRSPPLNAQAPFPEIALL